MIVGPKPGNAEFRFGQRQRRIPKRNEISKSEFLLVWPFDDIQRLIQWKVFYSSNRSLVLVSFFLRPITTQFFWRYILLRFKLENHLIKLTSKFVDLVHNYSLTWQKSMRISRIQTLAGCQKTNNQMSWYKRFSWILILRTIVRFDMR